MKWVQWSKPNPAAGLGGVEVHAQCLHDNLQKAGVTSLVTQDVDVLLSEEWDVIHTHGTNHIPLTVRKKISKKPIFAHTLHGTAFGRMCGCNEWTWVGGYKAAYDEMEGAGLADILFSIHPDLWLFKLARKVKGAKAAVICHNGWDSGLGKTSPLPTEVTKIFDQPEKFWIYIGRGQDKMKNVGVIQEAMALLREEKLLVVPGAGFQEIPGKIFFSGPLTSAQINTLLNHGSSKIKGLLLSSCYEGLPLVVLEALAHGVPVVSTDVGGMPTLPPDLRGLFIVAPNSPENFSKKMLEAKESGVHHERESVKTIEHNRRLLQTWKEVAEIYLSAVKKLLRS